MCGRYVFRNTNNTQVNPLAGTPFECQWEGLPKSEPRFNIAPTQLAPVITREGLVDMAFGMQPEWSKSSLINAKSENLLSSRFWKPMFALHPCLIPADGFYEPKGEQGAKRPWYGFEFEGSKPFVMAGVYSKQADGLHFVIVTKTPNSVLEPIHSRMPVLLTANQNELIKLWMNTEAALRVRAESIQENIEFEELKYFPVSDKAKNPRNEGAELFSVVRA